MRRLFWISMLLLCVSSGASAKDPFELNPASEQSVVSASWGNLPSQFTWPGDEWGKGEVGSFGPFCLDSEGRIYIADTAPDRNDVKVFGSNGSWLQSVPMIQWPNIVSGLAVYDGRIYWFGEAMPFMDEAGAALGRYRLLSVEFNPQGQSYTLSELALNRQLNLSRDERGREFRGNCSLQVTPEGLQIFARRSNISYPLVRGSTVVSPAEQAGAKSYGLKSDGVNIAFDFEHGDIVRLGPNGQIEKVLVRNAGWLWGAAGGRFLTECGQTAHGVTRMYFELRDNEGNLLSRTRMPERDCSRNIEIAGHARALQLAPDGSWYEMYVDDLGVHVSRFVRQ